ncbi:MAG TPA: MGMT family protein [Synergistales bacterium]|nr:MGMT family protein [Synergistales bacterium]HQO83728.1 MGMT family protein [Synergistales bacterium]HQQ10202.1 MGMT family protein [Synergistales bacterium]
MLAWHRRGIDEEVSSSVLDSPFGMWSVSWVPGGLYGITSCRLSGHGKVTQEVLPIWLERSWEFFWRGERPLVTYCYEHEIPEFSRRVLEVVEAIPFGEVLTYGQVAERAGNPKAARAVGSIMRSNPWALFIPCHRVIGSDGSLRGYGGPRGISLKKRLLAFEKKVKAEISRR